MLTTDQVKAAVSEVADALNLNFFCHREPMPDAERDQRWRAALAAYHAERGLDLLLTGPTAERAPFD